jgi:LAO/AO transport system ATPase
MIGPLLDRLRKGDRNALARLISHATRGEYLAELQAAVPDRTGRACVVAFTGSGGVGKSTLIGKLLALAQADGCNTAVLACDPQSPRTGGALLGDRLRMGQPAEDSVYIRSLAAVSGHGALADHLDVMIRLLDCFGFDWIFLETVGAGQGDVAVRELADVVVLMLQPESGDELQWEKAGILECADIVVVHKADLPSSAQTAAEVRAALDLSSAPAPVLLVSSKMNAGQVELWQAIHAAAEKLRCELPGKDGF